MSYILLWLLLGLIGYSLLVYSDIIEKISFLDKDMFLTSDRTEFKLYSKGEMLRGMSLALALGPVAIMYFIVVKK